MNKQLVFETLKLEQIERIALRETSLYIQILVSITVVGILYSNEVVNPLFGLIIPFYSLTLFSIYAANDIYVSRIQKYIMGDFLSPEIEGKSEDSWEKWHKRGPGYVLLKVFRVIALVASFLGPMIADLYWLSGLESSAQTLWATLTTLGNAAISLIILVWLSMR